MAAINLSEGQRASVPVPGSKGGHKGVDNGELHHYWTQDPEGLAKWRDMPHPWTALYNHLRKYIKNDHVAKATASAWYRDVFGHMPNQDHKEKKGGEPVGEVRAASVSDKPWSNFSAADYSPQQWRRACLIDTGQGDPDNKGRYKLPVREPDGTLNRNGCHAAASVLGGGRGGVQASPDAKKAAARKLASLYRSELNEDPPPSLTGVAGRSNRFDDAYSTKGERMTSPAFMKGVDGYNGKGGKPMGHGSVDECKAKLKQAIAAGDSQQIAELIDQLANMDPQQRGQQPSQVDERKGKMPFPPPGAKSKDDSADAGKDKGSDVDAQIANLQEQLKQAKAKGDDKAAAAIQAQIDKLRGGVDSAKGKTEGGSGKPPFLQGKGGAGRGGQPEGADERAGYGEGPGGSQKGPSVKAIKAHIKQAQEAGDTELVKKLKAKLAALQGDADTTGNDTDKDGRSGQLAEVEQRRASARAAMRSLPVIRSAVGSPATVLDDDELDERAAAPEGGIVVRASYRAERSEDGNPVMSLRFSQFNNWYEINSAREGKFLERVAPGAFSKTIGERGGQIKVLFNHGHDGQIGEKILGRVLSLEERSDGAHADIELFDTSYNRDLLPGLRAGAYGSSFMFNVMDDAWEDQPQRSDANPAGLPERTVRQLRLLEFGPVTWPANPGATAGLRSDTDAYCDGLRSAAPDAYNELEERFSEIRTAFNIGTSADQVARNVEVAPEDDDEGTSEDEAAFRDDAPVTEEHHAEQPETNSAETRRARLIFAGVMDAD
jgi:HK97 family phage prohead protease